MAVSGWLYRLEWALLGPRGAEGRVVLSSVLAGGICGGLAVGVLALLGRGSPGLHLLLAPALFLVGTVLGVAHGFMMALIAGIRRGGRSEALRRGLVGAVVSLPLMPLGWLVSSSIAVATALRAEMRASLLVVSGGGAFLGLLVCAWALAETWRTVRSDAGAEGAGSPSAARL